MSNYYILSYYEEKEGRIVKEYLVQHVSKMLKLLDPSSRAVEYGDHLLSRYGSRWVEGFYRVRFSDLLELSIVLHDIGKAFYSLDHGSGYLSFTGHEVFSVIIADELIFKCIEHCPEHCPSRSIFYPVLYSIMFHHHAMNITMRAVKALRRGVIGKTSPESIASRIVHDYESVRRLAGPFTNLMLDSLGDAVLEVARMSSKQINEVLRYISGELLRKLESGDTVVKRLMHLALTSLVALDYEAAYRVRGGTLTVFGRVCREWGRLYLGFRV